MSGNKQLKAGFWYTISNFLVKGITFLVTPIFTRLLSVNEYGDFSNYNAWRNLLLIIGTMSVAASLNRARFDFKDRVNEYIATIATMSIILPTILYCIVLLNIDFWANILKMDAVYVHVLFFSVIFPHVLDIFMLKKRIEYSYKTSVFLIMLNTLSTTGLALILVMSMSNRLMGRVLGQAIPIALIGIVLYIHIMKAGKKISWDMIKYAAIVSLPYVPHLLAGNLLAQSDRIMIKGICGSEETAYYSVACTCSMLLNVFLGAINQAWLPWFGERMNQKEYDVIKRKSKPYVLLFFAVFIGALIFAPEFLLIYGGKKYSEVIWFMPPLIAANMFQFIYTQYVNIEQFEKRVWRVAFSTIIAAGVNIALNYWLIPIFGYGVAAYTTLFGYATMCFLNYVSVRKMHMQHMYDNKFFGGILLTTVACCFASMWLYRLPFVRYFILVVYSCIAIYVLSKNKNLIRKIFTK